MTALILARITVRDPQQMQAYSAAAGPTVTAHGGAFIARGKHVETLLGPAGAPVVALIGFPSADAAKGWFASPEYQALSELRDAAADMAFTLYDAA